MRRPRRQGELDGLCGPYAVINALTALWPSQMTHARQGRLMAKFMKAIQQDQPHAVVRGTYARHVERMLDIAEKHIHRSNAFLDRLEWSQPWKHRPASKFKGGFDDFLDAFDHAIDGKDAVAIVGFAAPWSHWSVADRIEDGRVWLLDSSPSKAAPIRRLGFYRSEAPDQICHRITFVLRRDRLIQTLPVSPGLKALK